MRIAGRVDRGFAGFEFFDADFSPHAGLTLSRVIHLPTRGMTLIGKIAFAGCEHAVFDIDGRFAFFRILFG